MIAATGLRGGNAASAGGAASLAARAITTARECGCAGTISSSGLGVLQRRGDRGDPPRRRPVSVTVPVNASIRPAIAAIPGR